MGDDFVLHRNLENVFMMKKDELLQLISSKQYLLNHPDQHGNLPLHCHLGSHFIDKDILGLILSLAPQTIRVQGRFGRLPLHCSLCKGKNMFDVVKALLFLYPDAAGVQTQGGWTPLHYAVDRDAIDLDVVKILCIAYPKGLRIQDREGKLPLHWAIDRVMVDSNVIRFLAKLYPPALFAKFYKADHQIEDFIGLNAEELAMERGHFEIVRYMMMFNTPHRKARNRELFGSLNWSSRRHLLLAVYVRSREVVDLSFSTVKSSEEAVFLRLYDHHREDLWKYVVSFV